MAIAEDLEIAAFLKGQPKKLFIGGRWVEAASGKTFETLNPATGEVLAKVAEGGADDIDRAVAAARASFDRGTWRDLPPAERAKILWQVGDMIEERATEFAQLETLDNGMPINDALLFHAPLAAATFRYYAGWVTKLDGATQQISLPGKYLSYTLREPIGVVGQIIPWNFPLLMAAWKIAPALACGNSVVLKPSEETPLSALLLAELLQEAELPAGVLNVVPGRGETAGARLAAHPDVDKIAFTGSTEVGKLIAKASAESNLKRVSLELGGKSPNIVFADADLTKAVSGVFFAFYYNNLFPEQIFHISRSIEIILGPVIGGVGTLFGPVLGAAVLTLLSDGITEALGALGWEIPGIKQVFYGVVLLAVIMFLPHGIWPTLARRLGLK